MDRKLRHWPKTFMWSPRFKKVVFKSKLQQQQRSLNLSCSQDTIQCSAHISSSRSPNDLNLFFPGKLRQFPRTFMSKVGSNSDVRNVICLDKKIRIFTKSRVGHPLNNQSSNQQFQILAYKRRHLPYIQELGCSDQDLLLLSLSLYIFVMLKFCFH